MLWLWILLAQSNIKLINPITGTNEPSNAGVLGIWTTVAQGILALSTVAAVVMLIWAGFTWLTAAGSKEKISSAQQTIVWVFLGLLVISGAYAFLYTLINTLAKGVHFTQ